MKVTAMSLKDKIAFLISKRVILIRMGGEMGIKSRQTRRRMIRYLQNDIKRLLENYPTLKYLYRPKIGRFKSRMLGSSLGASSS